MVYNVTIFQIKISGGTNREKHIGFGLIAEGEKFH